MYGIFFLNLILIISTKMRGYPQFYPLAKIWPLQIVINLSKIPLLVGKFLKKPEYLELEPRCTERMRSTKRRHRP